MLNIRKHLGRDSALFYQDFEVFELDIEKHHPEIELEFNREQFKICFYYGWAFGKSRINSSTIKEVEAIRKMVKECEKNAKYAKIFSVLFFSLLSICIILLMIDILK